MKFRKMGGVVCVVLFLGVVAAPANGAADPVALAVTGVVAESRSLDASAPGAAIEWRYLLSREATLRASLYDARNVLVRRLVADRTLTGGTHRLRWDGRDDLGRSVPTGYYLLTIRATAGEETVTYDPSDRTGGTLIEASGERYDADAGMIRYALPDAAWVRVHLGLTNGLLLRTPVDWVARTAGVHEEPWDGKDESKVLDFGRSDQLSVQIWAYKLPVNAVVVSSPTTAGSAGSAMPAGGTREAEGRFSASVRSEYLDFPPDREQRQPDRPRKLEMYNHWLQDRAVARDPKVYVTAPEGWPRRDGAVVVNRSVGIRLNVIEDDEAFIQAERFETCVYLDGQFVFEEEQGYLPFTWRLEPELIPPGEHVISFMLRGYDGHFGSGSIKVYRPEVQTAENAGLDSRDKR